MASPTTSSNASRVAQSTSLNINALLGPSKWGGTAGSGAILTYSFPWTSSETAIFSGYNGDPYSPSNEPTATVHFGLNTTQQESARNALQAWANVANIAFSETKETTASVGDIRFGWTSASDEDEVAGAYYPSGYFPSGGDIWINSLYSTAAAVTWEPGHFFFETLLHELGHALGLKHPFKGTPVLPSSLDSELYSVMSYTSAPLSIYPSAGYVNGTYDWITYSIIPETPMVLDVAAIQYLYGVNSTYHTGNDIYYFDNAKPFFKTIWDAAGNDTLSASNFSLSCVIDLSPGQYSSLKYPPPSGDSGGAITTYDGTNNLGIAYGCIIENAIGGSGNDTITGNYANNIIDGGGGTDSAIFSGLLAGHSITKASSGRIVSSPADGVDTLSNIERLQFADKTIAFDIDGTAGEVYRLYQAALNRVPDQKGLGDWIEGMDGGFSLQQVATGFIGSPEFKTLYGVNPTNDQFVTLLYDNVLNRAPDTAGYNTWMNALANGMTKENVLIGFSESIENKLALMAFSMDSNIGQVYRLYQAALDRTPDGAGVVNWTQAMNNGMTLNNVATGFIDSAEFKALYGSNPTNEQFVTLLYDNVLHRTPDTAGANNWMAMLAGGMTHEEVLIGFSESFENQLSLVGIVQNGIEYA